MTDCFSLPTVTFYPDQVLLRIPPGAMTRCSKEFFDANLDYDKQTIAIEISELADFSGFNFETTLDITNLTYGNTLVYKLTCDDMKDVDNCTTKLNQI